MLPVSSNSLGNDTFNETIHIISRNVENCAHAISCNGKMLHSCNLFFGHESLQYTKSKPEATQQQKNMIKVQIVDTEHIKFSGVNRSLCKLESSLVCYIHGVKYFE